MDDTLPVEDVQATTGQFGEVSRMIATVAESVLPVSSAKVAVTLTLGGSGMLVGAV